VNETAREEAKAFGLNKTFRSVIKAKMEQFNSMDADALMRAQESVRGVKEVLVKNIEHLVENNVKIEILQDKAVALKEKSATLRK